MADPYTANSWVNVGTPASWGMADGAYVVRRGNVTLATPDGLFPTTFQIRNASDSSLIDVGEFIAAGTAVEIKSNNNTNLDTRTNAGVVVGSATGGWKLIEQQVAFHNLGFILRTDNAIEAYTVGMGWGED